MLESKIVSVLGLGYIGLPTAALFGVKREQWFVALM